MRGAGVCGRRQLYGMLHGVLGAFSQRLKAPGTHTKQHTTEQNCRVLQYAMPDKMLLPGPIA
eukprot:415495-Alexandrium_andersonii.AAC.1